MKRILLVSGKLALSGVATWHLHLQIGFSRRGDDVALLVLGEETPIRPSGKVVYTGKARSAFHIRIAYWLQLHKIFPRWYVQMEENEMGRRVRNSLRFLGWQDHCDLVVKNLPDKLPPCLNVWPMIGTIHSALSSNKGSLAKTLRRQQAFAQTDIIVGVSQHVANDARRLGLTVDGVIHNPLDIKEISHKSTLFVPGIDGPYILFIGRLSAEKGVIDLLQAFSLLKNNVALVYVGKGSEENELRRKAISWGIQDKVHFMGFQDNPYPWMRHAKLLILPSSEEAMGYVLMEAAALGCGVLAADFSAASEFLIEEAIVSRQPATDYAERLAARISKRLCCVGSPLGVKDGVLEGMEPCVVANKYMRLLEGSSESGETPCQTS